ncbi:MAG: hypothetical protein IJZ57_10055 [Clostridia bacterium]|nr:hypothetical protein [Clostridia bacterium]
MSFFTSPAFLLAVIFVVAVVYSLYAKIRDSKAAAQAPAEQQKAQPEAKPVAAPASAGPEIVGADDKTAAVIMALVSHKSGIPLNRLSFKSIRLMEDK